jgi:hypothetical protein
MSTLISVALVLLIAILAKALITVPPHANAAQSAGQSAAQIKEYVVDFIGERSIEKALGERAKEGMRFVTVTNSSEPSVKILIFEK